VRSAEKAYHIGVGELIYHLYAFVLYGALEMVLRTKEDYKGGFIRVRLRMVDIKKAPMRDMGR